MKKSFRDRDPLTMGVVGVTGVARLVFDAFNLSLLRDGTVYHAAFTEAGKAAASAPVPTGTLPLAN